MYNRAARSGSKLLEALSCLGSQPRRFLATVTTHTTATFPKVEAKITSKTPRWTTTRLVDATDKVPQMQSVFARNEGITLATTSDHPVSFTRFDALFLRDQCACEHCVSPNSGQKTFATAEIPSSISIKSSTQDEAGSLHIEWLNDIPGFPKHHRTVVPAWRIARTAANRTVDQETFAVKPVDNHELAQRYQSGASRATFQKFLSDEQTFLRILNELSTYGLAFFDQVPHSEESVAKLAERIGPIRNTFYGRTWDVKDVPKATNVAYTSGYLGMHMDLMYLKQPPALQLLHCLEASTEGGASLFVDAFEGAKQVYKMSPDAFNALCEFPVSYHYQAPGTSRYHYDTKQTIELGDGAIKIDGDALMPMISNMNWSPPFQGPFQENTGTHDGGFALRRYHAAACAFAEYVNDSSNQFALRMDPGQCVIFSNRRILHGRDAFRSVSGARWLKGCYTDIDEFQSALRYRNAQSIGELV